MPHTFYLVPSGTSVGLTTLALGLFRALDNRGIRVAFFKPIAQPSGRDPGPERSTHFIRRLSPLTPSEPIPFEEAGRLIVAHRQDELLERVVRDYHTSAGNADVVIVEGLVETRDTPGASEMNLQLVHTLSAEVIVVGALGRTPVPEFLAHLELSASHYGGFGQGRVIGCIVNRVPVADAREAGLLDRVDRRVIGAVPENADLAATRAIDFAKHLEAEIIHAGQLATRRVKKIHLLARTIPNLIATMSPGALLMTPGDRSDVVVMVALAAASGIPIACLVLTGDIPLPPGILDFCRSGLEAGLPIVKVSSSSLGTATRLAAMSTEIPADDLERVQRAMDFVAQHVDADWLVRHSQVPAETRMSPAAFCFRLSELARQADKRIVLPEGAEPRTVRAAAICAQRGIARCVLIGNPDEIRRVAVAQEVTLPANVELLDPTMLRGHYVTPLVELRKSKGLSAQAAADLLEDNVWLGTVMLALGEVDGLVSGAVHSTANTIRPALQIIKTKPGAKVVSSIFFMCLPDQVLVYGDCAVVPDPDAETLADIAIQSADSAARFGIAPRVAMISYSTGESGSGSDVDKVREATRLAQKLRPELLLDGPLQYDAAAIADVAATKAPHSPVAGRATVFVFPDLNTGNTTYKAVQRSAHVISIGPMLQGMRRPVNDLSRGALVEDIVYTIALTAIQATERPEPRPTDSARHVIPPVPS